MATYVVQFYDFDPLGLLGTGANVGSTFVYNEEDTPSGVATIQDNGVGAGADVFDDDDAGEGATTATATIGGATSTGVSADNEMQWTVRDVETGEVFQVAQLDIEGGSAAGLYTLSERPLIPGHTYEIVAYDSYVNANGGDTTFAWSDYDGVFDGTSGNDTMAPGSVDAQGDILDQTTTASVLSWEDTLGTNDILGGGGTTTINGVTIDYSVVDNGPASIAAESSETPYDSNIYVASGESFDPTSSLFLFGNNGADGSGGTSTATVNLDFSAADPTGDISGEVTNVTFRISDIDVASFVDTVTITATDAAGNPVTITLTPGTGMAVSGDTATANAGSVAGNTPSGSLLVEIPGPVSNISIDYGNLGTNQQGILISDVHFDAVTTGVDDVVTSGDGDDVIDTGAGDDLVYAGTGDDTITGGSGDDTLYGEAGSDTFIGGEGADVNYGASGQDTVDYSTSTGAVNVDLSTGSFSGGYAEGDSGPGIDGIIGSDFDDTLIGFDGQGFGADAYTNVLDGGAGDDYIDGRDGDDILLGGDGLDTILGGGGDDDIDGGTGNDTIYGGAGADTIQGGEGDDTIYLGGGDVADGGDGNDTFIFDPSQLDGNAITIVGSETGDDTVGDTLDLDSLGGLFTPGSISYSTPDRENGSLTLTDGTVINFSNIETIICFGRGTRIETPYGPRPVESLKAGDLVLTLDHGPQPLRWIGSREVAATGNFAPIDIAAGVFGNSAPLTVSPQHRMLLNGWRAEMLFGASEVFAPAKYFINDQTVRTRTGGTVEYFHLMFDAHEVVFAEGAPSESLYPSEHSLGALTESGREEVFTLFPELRAMPYADTPTARRCLKEHEAQLLIA